LPQALALWRNGMGIEEGLVLESELAAVRSDAERRIDELTAALDRQNRTSEQLQQVLASTVETTSSQKAALEAAERELSKLTEELAAERASPRGNPEQLAALQRDIEARSKVIDEQQARIAVLEVQMVGQRAQLTASAATAAIHERQLNEALSTIATQQAENASLSESLARSEARISVLQRDIATAKAGVEEQQRRATDLEAEIARLSVSGTDGAGRTAALEQQLERARREVDARTSDLTRMQRVLESQRASFAQTLQSTNAQRAELQQELAQFRAEREQLEAQLDQRDAEVSALRDQISARNRELATFEAEQDSLRDQIAKAETSSADATLIADLRRQLAAKQQELAEQTEQVASLEVQWELASGQVASLKRELETRALGDDALEEQYRAKVALLDQRILDITKERDVMTQALDDQRREKAQLRLDINMLEDEMRRLQASVNRQTEANREQIRILNEEITRKGQEVLARDATIRTLNMELEDQKFARDRLRIERYDIDTLVAGTTRGPTPTVSLPADVDLGKYRFHALIIGNQDYTFLNDLSTVENDVNDVKVMLEQIYGFDQVDVRMDLTRDAMYAELGKLKDYSKDAFVLIYYAGHGAMDEFDNGYWQPVDFVPGKNPASSGISVAQITQYLNMMQAKHVMVVADSCYSGALLRDNTVEIQNVDQRLKHWVNNASRTVLTSGGMAPVLDKGGDGRHSVFAKAFIDVLADNGGVLSGEALHARIRDRIRAESQALNLEQTPQFAGLADAGHANGQFVFVRRGEPQARLN
jgi:chromosome segregation ATPase